MGGRGSRSNGIRVRGVGDAIGESNGRGMGVGEGMGETKACVWKLGGTSRVNAAPIATSPMKKARLRILMCVFMGVSPVRLLSGTGFDGRSFVILSVGPQTLACGPIAVGQPVARLPPHRSRRAELPHRALQKDSLSQRLRPPNAPFSSSGTPRSWVSQCRTV